MKKAIFIGQAMPRYKSNLHDWPSLNSWLYSIGITHDEIVENFFFSALVDYFPGAKNGSHRVPTTEEIEKEKSRLTKTIKDFSPEIVVPIGKLSISYCLDKKIELKKVVGKKFIANPYGVFEEISIIPLPHPSGASTWYKKKGNYILLSRALKLIRSAINVISVSNDITSPGRT